MPGNIANVKCCYLYETMSPSEQHIHNLFIIHKYLLNSTAEYFNMYITNLLFSKLIILQVSMGFPVKSYVPPGPLFVAFVIFFLYPLSQVKHKWSFQWPNRPYTNFPFMSDLLTSPLFLSLSFFFSLPDSLHVWIKCKIPLWENKWSFIWCWVLTADPVHQSGHQRCLHQGISNSFRNETK